MTTNSGKGETSSIHTFTSLTDCCYQQSTNICIIVSPVIVCKMPTGQTYNVYPLCCRHGSCVNTSSGLESSVSFTRVFFYVFCCTFVFFPGFANEAILEQTFLGPLTPTRTHVNHGHPLGIITMKVRCQLVRFISTWIFKPLLWLRASDSIVLISETTMEKRT